MFREKGQKAEKEVGVKEEGGSEIKWKRKRCKKEKKDGNGTKKDKKRGEEIGTRR